jgi:hypothetical protein
MGVHKVMRKSFRTIQMDLIGTFGKIYFSQLAANSLIMLRVIRIREYKTLLINREKKNKDKNLKFL